MDTITLLYASLLSDRAGFERTRIPARPGLSYEELLRSAPGARETGLDRIRGGELPDGVLLFYRNGTGGLQLVHDPTAAVPPSQAELVLTTSMSGG